MEGTKDSIQDINGDIPVQMKGDNIFIWTKNASEMATVAYMTSESPL